MLSLSPDTRATKAQIMRLRTASKTSLKGNIPLTSNIRVATAITTPLSPSCPSVHIPRWLLVTLWKLILPPSDPTSLGARSPLWPATMILSAWHLAGFPELYLDLSFSMILPTPRRPTSPPPSLNSRGSWWVGPDAGFVATHA
jgi:hypothetical protein